MVHRMAADILIVDDENDIRDLVAGILSDEGYSTRTAAHADAALSEIAARRPNLIFLDIWLQGSRVDGLALLDEIRKDHDDLPVVMISGHGNIETAVSSIKRGAYDYIEKPFKSDRLVHVAERAMEASKLRREIKELREKATDSGQLLGDSAPMNALRGMIEKVAPTNSRVMISGMSGVGKELVARAIHDASSRGGSPFIAINSATITPDRMEHELFGTEPANGTARKIGALEEAHGGTLYLDEVADMPRETQNKILRVLVDQSFQRLGGTSWITVDVRIISSTAQDLGQSIEDGDFREDLFHRLAVVPLRVPALSERRADIPLLVRHFVDQIARATGLPSREIGDDAMAILQAHDWPGNIRQLRNNVERLLILARGGAQDVIHSDMLPAEIGEMLPTTPGQGAEHLMSLPLRDAREIFERDYLTAQVTRFGGNISRTAEFVGMERSALHRKLKSLGVN
jgi:two-component system nitrogen regulation response regulator NtrX